jgi:hypothetical protein
MANGLWIIAVHLFRAISVMGIAFFFPVNSRQAMNHELLSMNYFVFLPRNSAYGK